MAKGLVTVSRRMPRTLYGAPERDCDTKAAGGLAGPGSSPSDRTRASGRYVYQKKN